MRHQGSFSLFGEDPRPSGGALISDDGRYRFTLTREWSEGKQVCFIGLNPSTADATLNDPTIRRCIAFAKREGGGRLLMLNLFNWRATDPAALLGMGGHAVGEVDIEIGERAGGADLIVCAWGAVHKSLRWRADQVEDMFCGDRQLLCLGYCADGSPRHPLYVRGDAPLLPWPAARRL